MTSLVETVRQEIIALETERVDIVTIGIQGLPGIAGEAGRPGTPGGAGFEDIAEIALGGHRAVVFSASGKLIYASSSNLEHLHRIAGITITAANAEELVSVMRSGEVTEPSWNWDITLPVYLADNGLLTQTPPATPVAAFSVVVGFPTSATSLFVTIREPIILI